MYLQKIPRTAKQQSSRKPRWRRHFLCSPKCPSQGGEGQDEEANFGEFWNVLSWMKSDFRRFLLSKNHAQMSKNVLSLFQDKYITRINKYCYSSLPSLKCWLHEPAIPEVTLVKSKMAVEESVSEFSSLCSELRAMCCEQSLLNKVDGSVSFCQGEIFVQWAWRAYNWWIEGGEQLHT